MTLNTRDREAYDRLLGFVGMRIRGTETVKVVDVRPIEEPEVGAGDQRLLSLVEMAVPRTSPGGDKRDHLGVIIKMTNPLDTTTTSFYFTFDVLLPETLRSFRRETATMVYVNDLMIAGETHETEVIFALIYALRRNQRTDRLLADLQRFVGVLKQTTGAARILSLAQAIIDRIEVLEEAGDGEIVLSGSLSGFGSVAVRTGSAHYMALVSGEMAAAQGQWWVRGSNLQIGDSAETAVPVPDSSHLLLRYGPRSTQQDVRRFIDELRRRHTMNREELQTTEEGENYESYVENEVERQRQSVTEAIYSEHKMLPVVTPVAVEFAAELEPEIALGTDPETAFQKRINTMQENIKDSYGVSIPNLRVRANNTDMPPGSYLFMLNEIPIVMGTVSLEKHFCDATVEQLGEIGITAQAASNPADRSAGAFIATVDAEEAEAHRFHTWGPGEYVALHLDSLLRKNLTLFLGTDDIAAGLTAPDTQGLLAQLRAARGGLARFRTVLLALLYEELPVRPLPVLARRYLELVDHPAYHIAEDLRLLGLVNQHLVRDAMEWRVFALSDAILDVIERHIVCDADAALLAIEPEDTQEVLSAVRDMMRTYASDGRLSVILVEDWRLRPFIRKLVELEFPQLRVVAKREVDALDPGLLEPAAVIALA